MARDLLYRIVKTKEVQDMYYCLWDPEREAFVVMFDSPLRGSIIESAWYSHVLAAARVHWLNGGGPDEFLYGKGERQDA